LKVGRHFRLSSDAKLVVGRNKDENEVIKALVTEDDTIIEAKDYVGPTCMLRCKKYDHALLARCAAIALRYSDAPRDAKSKVVITSNRRESEVTALPADVSTTDTMRI